jgi:hypothetical protein
MSDFVYGVFVSWTTGLPTLAKVQVNKETPKQVHVERHQAFGFKTQLDSRYVNRTERDAWMEFETQQKHAKDHAVAGVQEAERLRAHAETELKRLGVIK